MHKLLRFQIQNNSLTDFHHHSLIMAFSNPNCNHIIFYNVLFSFEVTPLSSCKFPKVQSNLGVNESRQFGVLFRLSADEHSQCSKHNQRQKLFMIFQVFLCILHFFMAAKNKHVNCKS